MKLLYLLAGILVTTALESQEKSRCMPCPGNSHLSIKKERKFLRKLKQYCKKNPNFEVENTQHPFLQKLIPALPIAKQNQILSPNQRHKIQEDIDYTLLMRLNAFLHNIKATQNSTFDVNKLTQDGKSLLHLAVENGYYLTTNRLLSIGAIANEKIIKASTAHGILAQTLLIQQSLKQHFKTHKKEYDIEGLTRKQSKKTCHFYKKFSTQDISKGQTYRAAYKQWHHYYKSIPKLTT